MSTPPGYVPVELGSLNGDLPLFLDVYIMEGQRYLLYRGSSSSRHLTLDGCRRLQANGVTRVWLRLPADERLRAERLTSILALPDDQFPPLVKARVWYGAATATAQRAMDNLCPEMMTDIGGFIGLTMNYLARNASSLPALLHTMIHDQSLYTHAINVAVYSLGLGMSIGMTAESHLAELGLAAILHDVGKARFPKELLSKSGTLSSEEWAVVRQHPTWGFEALSAVPQVPGSVLVAVLQHHERLDGSGYPEGLAGPKLGLFSLIVALADSFDAMISARSYKRTHTPYRALAVLKKDIEAGKYDPGLFVRLVLLMRKPGRIGNQDLLTRVRQLPEKPGTNTQTLQHLGRTRPCN